MTTDTSSSGTSATTSETKITNNNNGNPLLVAVVDRTVATSSPTVNHQEHYRPVRLPSPSRPNLEQEYLLLTTQNNANRTTPPHYHIMELQSLDRGTSSAASLQPQPYQAWLVGNTVVANGTLHVISRVDPLFWIVATLDPTELQDTTIKQPWQPLEQLWSAIPAPVQQALQTYPHQMQHLAATYRMGDDDDDDDNEVFYKVQYDKIMTWLSRKQRAVQRVLEHQRWVQVQREATSDDTTARSGGGAFAAGFSLTSQPVEVVSHNSSSPESSTEAPLNRKETPVTLTADQLQQAHYESLQIICNYLSPAWQSALLEQHLKLNPTKVLEDPVERQRQERLARDSQVQPTPRNRVLEPSATSRSVTPVTPVVPAPPPKPKLSLGHKQLLKVNKKGMKPMTSFFAVQKKKK